MLFFIDVHSFILESTGFFSAQVINDSKRIEWSPIRSVIMRMINKIGRTRSGIPICYN